MKFCPRARKPDAAFWDSAEVSGAGIHWMYATPKGLSDGTKAGADEKAQKGQACARDVCRTTLLPSA